MKIKFSIPILAVAKARAKRGRAGNAYIPKKTKIFEQSIRWHWMKEKLQTFPEIPTMLTVICFVPRPKKPKKKTAHPITRPDVDNYAKSVLDALNGFAWRDDNQITDLIIRKRYAELHPRIEIEIEESL